MEHTPTPQELQMKKFRHDVSNHLAVIESFLSVCKMMPMNEDLIELRELASASFTEVVEQINFIARRQIEAN